MLEDISNHLDIQVNHSPYRIMVDMNNRPMKNSNQYYVSDIPSIFIEYFEHKLLDILSCDENRSPPNVKSMNHFPWFRFSRESINHSNQNVDSKHNTFTYIITPISHFNSMKTMLSIAFEFNIYSVGMLI